MYGNINENGGNSFTGKVGGYKMIGFGLNEQGSLQIEFRKDLGNDKNITLKVWINRVDEANVTPFQGKTLEETVRSYTNKINRTVKNLICNYCSTSDYEAAMKGVSSFEEFVQAAISCLSPGFGEKEGWLMVGYNSK